MYEQAAEAGISLLFLAPLYLASLRDNISEFVFLFFWNLLKQTLSKKGLHFQLRMFGIGLFALWNVMS